MACGWALLPRRPGAVPGLGIDKHRCLTVRPHIDVHGNRGCRRNAHSGDTTDKAGVIRCSASSDTADSNHIDVAGISRVADIDIVTVAHLVETSAIAQGGVVIGRAIKERCEPIAVLKLPLILFLSAEPPNAMLPLPSTLLKAHRTPIGMLPPPLSLRTSALVAEGVVKGSGVLAKERASTHGRVCAGGILRERAITHSRIHVARQVVFERVKTDGGV